MSSQFGPHVRTDKEFYQCFKGPLSKMLPEGKRGSGNCWFCGAKYKSLTLKHWIECDESDKATDQYIVLCLECSDALIERHPTLYEEKLWPDPMPGVMPQCDGCRFSKAGRCTNPQVSLGNLKVRYESFLKVFFDSENERGIQHWPDDWPRCLNDGGVVIDEPGGEASG